jgi:hypothetical protein
LLATLATASLVAGTFLSASAVLAVHDEGFQLEGNVQSGDLSFTDHDVTGSPPKPVELPGTLSGDMAGPYDWAGSGGIFNNDGSEKSPLPNGFISADFQKDFLHTGTTFITSDSTTFATGSKDGLDISGWQCNTDNNVNIKIDIANGYAAVYNSPFVNPPDPAGASHEFLVFGLEKDVDNGDNNIGLWLFKDPTVDCVSSGPAKTFTGLHTVGDVLVVSAFTKGGGVSTISAYIWVADNNPQKAGLQPGLDPNPIAASADCLDTNQSGTSDRICGTINGKPINVPWPTVQSGVVNLNGDPTKPISVPNFVEGGVDLTALGLDQASGNCFNRYMLDTRSSASIPATLFDYVIGTLPTCQTSVEMTKTPNPTDVCIGNPTPVEFTYVVDNTGNIAITNGSIVDNHGTPADTSDDVTITVGSIAAGGSATVTTTYNVSATQTNTAVFTGTSVIGQVSATATATVNGLDCSTVLSKTASVDATITYSYSETNDGDVDLASPVVTDDNCATVVGVETGGFNNGDTDQDGLLSVGETWLFTCTTSITGITSSSSTTNIATGDAIGPNNVHITPPFDPDETDSTTVDITITNH